MDNIYKSIHYEKNQFYLSQSNHSIDAWVKILGDMEKLRVATIVKIDRKKTIISTRIYYQITTKLFPNNIIK